MVQIQLADGKDMQTADDMAEMRVGLRVPRMDI